MPDKKRKLRCPDCGHDTFIRHCTDEVEMTFDGEDVTDEIVDEASEPDRYTCAKCGENVRAVDMTDDDDE